MRVCVCNIMMLALAYLNACVCVCNIMMLAPAYLNAAVEFRETQQRPSNSGVPHGMDIHSMLGFSPSADSLGSLNRRRFALEGGKDTTW